MRVTSTFSILLPLTLAGCIFGKPPSSTDSGDDFADADTDTDPNATDDDGDGYSEDDGDCDDTKSRINPDAEENCDDRVDNNCDGQVNEDCSSSGDTGTAYLFTKGTADYDGSSVAVTYAYGAQNLATGDWVCEMGAEYYGTSDGPSGCPDCTYAFDTSVTGGGTTGAYCSSWLSGYGYIFTDYSYTDFWWADDSIRDGWGWADDYTYVATDGTEYDLESVLFDHITYSGYDSYGDPVEYNGWYFRAYNFPDSGIYHVTGNSRSAEWQAYDYDSGGSKTYYYFYY